jgi:2-oxoglutarate ferredoxin oxidoreductase subunit gamma
LYQDVVIAGFGGQGVIFSGKLLAMAGLRQGLEVVYYPSYGAEMRGGTANCTVITSDKMIPSPIVSRPMSCIVMSLPAMEKFMPRLRQGGLAVVNTSLVPAPAAGEDIRVFGVPASNIAEEQGTSKAANMVILGAWAYLAGTVSLDSLVASVAGLLSGGKKALLETNQRSLREGWSFAANTH